MIKLAKLQMWKKQNALYFSFKITKELKLQYEVNHWDMCMYPIYLLPYDGGERIVYWKRKQSYLTFELMIYNKWIRNSQIQYI